MQKFALRWQVVALLLVLLAAANLFGAAAQDAPPAEATAEATVEAPPVVIEATEEPTVETPTEPPPTEATSEPTAEPTVEATTEPTAEATTEATAEPTVEATPAPPTPEPLPPLALLFAENFDDGNLSEWVAGISWVLLANESGQMMQAINGNDPLTLSGVPYYNVAISVRFQFATGAAQVAVRSSDVLNYSAALDTFGTVILSRAGVPVAMGAVAPVDPAAWTELRVSAIGNTVRVAINGVEAIVFVDAEPLPPGAVALSANFPPDADPANPTLDTLQVDDFALYVPTSELANYPTPQPTEAPPAEPTAAPEVTAEPTVEATVEPTDVPVEVAAVGQPTLKTPLNNSFVNTPRPTLAWFTLANADRYRIDLSVTPDFSAGNVFLDRETAALSYALNAVNLPNALPQARYYWRVQGRERVTLAWGPESEVFNFTVDLAKTPAGGANIFSNTPVRPTFVWTPAGIAGASYFIEIATDANFTTIVFENSAAPIGGTSFPLPVANALGPDNYWWRVRVIVSSTTLPIDPTHNIGNAFTVSPPIGRPVLVAPANLLVTTDRTWGFDWNDVPAIPGFTVVYQLQVDTTNTFAAPLTLDQGNIPASTFDAPEFMDGVYFWRVRALVQELNAPGLWSPVWKVTFDTTARPIRPANNSFTQDTTPTFGWDRVPGATGYCLIVDDNPDLLSPLTPNPFNGGPVNAVAYTPTTPFAFDTYFWRVDANIDGDADCETAPNPVVFSFTVTPRPLAAPRPVAPPNGSATNDTTPTLIWTRVEDGANAISYEIEVDTTNRFNSVNKIVLTVNGNPGSGNPQIDVTPALGQGTWYWRVRTRNFVNAPGPWSAIWRFIVDTTAPAAPVPTAPANGATTTNARQPFSWGPSTGATVFHIMLSTQNGGSCTFANPIIVSTGAARAYTPPAPLLYRVYCWQVRAMDAAGNQSPWSLPIYTVTINSAVGIAPIPNRFTTATPTLTWTPVSWADNYVLEIDDTNTFANPILYSRSNIAGTATSHTVEQSLPNGTYYWRVRATEPGAPINWSSVGTFQVDVP